MSARCVCAVAQNAHRCSSAAEPVAVAAVPQFAVEYAQVAVGDAHKRRPRRSRCPCPRRAASSELATQSPRWSEAEMVARWVLE
eukprot:28402-Pleurochrysis_carterae.AAC.1